MVLGLSEKLSLKYHDIFNYPLSEDELTKWKFNTQSLNIDGHIFSKIRKLKIESRNGFYFLKGKNTLVKKRLERERYSKHKLTIAKKASRILRQIPYIKFVGITGSLAMNNAGKDSDIDLIIITSQNRLWTTRLIAYFYLLLNGIKVRKPRDKNENDKLCLNMWIDETKLGWNKRDRNVYAAHEISQIVPLIDKDEMYRKLIQTNHWIFFYWPNALVQPTRIKTKKAGHIKKAGALENILYRLQSIYMAKKITNENVGLHIALFHPNNWGKSVFKKLLS